MIIKENLYCIPYNKKITTRRKDATSYHCEKNVTTPKNYSSDNSTMSRSKEWVSPENKKKDLKNTKETPNVSNDKFFKFYKCDVCKRDFQDERCLKIHKTKMDHWQKKTSEKLALKRRRTSIK